MGYSNVNSIHDNVFLDESESLLPVTDSTSVSASDTDGSVRSMHTLCIHSHRNSRSSFSVQQHSDPKHRRKGGVTERFDKT